MSDRNPAIDPQRGDIVRAPRVRNGKGVERHVTARRGGNIDYLMVTPTSTRPRNCWISTWQQWCADERVEIIQVGEP